MVASVRPGRLTPMPRSRSTENACGEVTSCTRWRSTYKTAGASSVSGRTRCASQSLPKSVRGSDCATHHLGLGGRLALQASRGDSVHHLQVGLGAGEDDVGAQAAPAIGAALVLDDDDHFTLRILAGADARDGEVAQTRFHAGDALDALEDGVDRTVAGGRLVELPPVAGEERHGGSGRRAGAADRVEARQLPAARRPVLEEADEQRVEVAVVDLLLLVREPLQLLEYLVDLLRLELVAEIVQPRVQRMAAAVLAEHEVAALEADVLGPHHLVRLLVVDHPVLVDAGFVGEGVLPDHRLVARDVESRRSRHHPARRAELLRTDARAQAEEVVARAQRHHHFLERTVPGALADPVDGTLHLPRPRLERRQAVGYRHAEIVMAVDAEHHAGASALRTASMSGRCARASAQMTGPSTCREIASTAWKSPGDATGNPTSITSTPSAARAFATCIFCERFMLPPGACSPSRSVVSNTITRSLPSLPFVFMPVAPACGLEVMPPPRRPTRPIRPARRFPALAASPPRPCGPA